MNRAAERRSASFFNSLISTREAFAPARGIAASVACCGASRASSTPMHFSPFRLPELFEDFPHLPRLRGARGKSRQGAIPVSGSFVELTPKIE